jgi:tripartite-type tricarboxylate transporter receptor subunit TctC
VAVTTTTRSPLAIDIPTFAEGGVPGYEASAWAGLFFPRATPLPIIQKWNTELNRIIGEPEVRERFKAAGLVAAGGSERDFRTYCLKETERWAAVVKVANITASP